MLDPQTFRRFVIRPALTRLNLYSPAAEALLLGTAIVESGLSSLVQTGGGGALAAYWKAHFNTAAGKATAVKFIDTAGPTLRNRNRRQPS